MEKEKDQGVAASPPGHSAEPEPVPVSAAPAASVPNAGAVGKLVEKMQAQLFVWEDEEPREDWWNYQREYGEAFLLLYPMHAALFSLQTERDDLLEALELASNSLTVCVESGGVYVGEGIFEKINAAIAKATGAA